MELDQVSMEQTETGDVDQRGASLQILYLYALVMFPT